ncbi:MAG: hypothetical protein AAFN30_04695 [Actinomycetota bacterium]
MLGAGCAGSDTGETLEFDAVLTGRNVADATAFDPVPLHHEEITELELDIVNVSNQPVTIAHVRLEGQMLDFIFLSYDTGINETLQPGERRRIAFALDFFDLEGQAHGLLRANLRLFGPEREPLAQTPFVVDGRGSPLATMAVFNLVLAVLAGLSLSWNLVRLAQRRLPAHRFARGLRFVHSGAALGLAASAAASTLRIWPLTTVTWVLITVLSALVAFAAGYASPGADDDGLVIDLDQSPPTTLVAPGLGLGDPGAEFTRPVGDLATDAFRVTNPLPHIERTEGGAPPFGRILTD